MPIRYLVALLLAATVARGDVFEHTWEGGYFNRSGRLGNVPDNTYTAWSQNGDPNSDGTWTKRFGTVLDYAAAGADTAVNGLFTLRNTRYPYPKNWGVAVVGPKFFKRNNDAGTWTEIDVPDAIKTDGYDVLQATEYDGQLIIGGDISALARFDGHTLGRLILPIYADSSSGAANASDGITGSELMSGTYHYFWSWMNTSGRETYHSPLIRVSIPEDSSYCANITGMPLYPSDFEGSADTTQVAARILYRSEDGGVTGQYLAKLNTRQTAYYDSGNVAVGSTVAYRSYEQVPYGRFPTPYGDQLWINIGDNPSLGANRSQFKLSSDLTDAVGSSRLTIEVTPQMDSRHQIGKVLVTTSSSPVSGIAAVTWTDLGDGRWICEGDSANFIDKGVNPGDYVVLWSAPQVETGVNVHSVVSVLSNTQIVVTGDIESGIAPIGSGSIGNNIIRINDEVIGVAFAFDSGKWYVGRVNATGDDARGLFGTTVSSHSAGDYIYITSSSVAGYTPNQLFVSSENANALRFKLHEPHYFEIEKVVGMFPGDGYIGVVGPNATYSITGDYPYLYTTPIASDVGSYSTPYPYKGGAFVLDDVGPHFVSSGGADYLGYAFDTAITDSAYAPRYDDARMFVHGGKLYVSVVDNDTLSCTIYVADLRRGTEWDSFPWTRYKGIPARSFATWADNAGSRDLFMGLWDEGAILRADSDATYDESSDGTHNAIDAILVTPIRSVPGTRVNWKTMFVEIDTNDSLTVTGYFGNRSTETSRVIGTIAVADSSSRSGQMREYSFPINATSDYAYFEFRQSSATSRLTIGPMRVHYEAVSPLR